MRELARILKWFFIRFPLEFLHVSGSLTRWCASTLGAALLCSSSMGSDVIILNLVDLTLYMCNCVNLSSVQHPKKMKKCLFRKNLSLECFFSQYLKKLKSKFTTRPFYSIWNIQLLCNLLITNNICTTKSSANVCLKNKLWKTSLSGCLVINMKY